MNQTEQQPVEPLADRRAFLKKFGAVAAGAIAAIFPFLSGLALFFDPLRRRSHKNSADFVPVASLNALPGDGLPRKFPVITSRVDAWTKSAAIPVGAVYLRRVAENKVQAFNVVCPHAGCFVDFVPGRKGFFCPCHNSAFGLDGRIDDPKSPSPRGLDELEVQIRNENEIWVKFQNFRAGEGRKIPLA